MSKKVLVMLCIAMLFHQERAGFVNDLVFEIRPRDVIYFGDQVNPDLIDIAQTEAQAQFISDNYTKVLQDMLGQDLRPNTMLVISTKSAELLADIWKETRQHNFVYATWIIIGPTIAIVEQSVTMYMIGIGNGFSPQMALFFLNQRCRAEGNQSCNITQIIGNGLERPILKPCGLLGQSCNLTKSALDIANNLDFNGQSMVASYEHWKPFSIENDDGSVSGILPNLARDAGKLLNLSIQFVPFRDRENFGIKLPNGSWTGNLGDVVSGLVQTSASGYMVTADRFEVVDFTPPLTTSVVAMFIKRPGSGDISAQNYLSQYPLTSWTLIGAMLLLCWTIITSFIHWQVQKSPSKNHNQTSIVHGTETIFLALINKPPQLKPNTLSKKVAYFSLFLMSLVLMSYYKALLKAALSVRNLKLPINSFQDILDSDLDLILWKNGALEDSFRLSAPDSDLKRIHESKIKDKPGANDLGGNAPVMELVKNGQGLFYASAENKMVLPIYPCQVTDVKPLRGRMNLAMPFKKDSPFLYSFQKAMDKLRQDGVVNRVETEFKLALKLKELVDCDAGLMVSLGLAQTFFPFACLLFGAGVSMVALSMEKLKTHKSNNRSNDIFRTELLQKQHLRKIINDKTESYSIKELKALADSL